MNTLHIEKKTILIVEDDEINRLILKEILCGEYQILVAKNGLEAFDILKEGHAVSLIILDIQMTVINEFEFLENVRKDSVYNKIPIIVTMDGVEKKCLELGASEFIVKPYVPAIVQLRVRNIIRLRECNDIISNLELDGLTGFKTRRAYYNDIEAIERDHGKRMQPVGIVFMDINGLKQKNDKYGHNAGDELIVTVAKDITAIFPVAKKYRLGGDEFLIFSFDTEKKEFEKKLAMLTRMWEKDCVVAVGSIWLENADNLEKNVAKADKKMYQDKRRCYERRGCNNKQNFYR